MSLYKNKIGKIGEELAAKYLQANSYEIIDRNFRTKSGEIDIIAKKKNKVSFVEVKTRIGLDKGYPHEAVDKRKIRHLHLAANWFLLQNPYKNYKLSIDLVSIILNEDLSVKNLKYFENIESE